MTRLRSTLATALFLVLAPGTVAGLIPWWISDWQPSQTPFAKGGLAMAAGSGLIILGLVWLLDSFARFAIQGRGTPAPVLSAGRLIVGGLYRWVRNPMYIAVLSLILGQALLLGDGALLAYGASMWLIFQVFVLAYEEPTLRKRFPGGYAAYVSNVPRWLPRLTPWEASKEDKNKGKDKGA